MNLFTIRQRDRVRPSRTSRRMRPAVEGIESRQLLSTGTISGTVLSDFTGNGISGDDAPLAKVTVDLYQQGSTTLLKSTTTDSNGDFSFSGVAAGSYSLKQVVPNKMLATGGVNGYSLTLKSGQTLSGETFDDFALLPTPSLSQVKYTLTPPGGTPVTVSSLRGNVKQGETVTASFNVKTAEVITLVAYNAPNNDFDTSNLQHQTIFSEASTNGKTGTQSLTVTVPNGYFQIDFVAGPAIDHLETNGNILYHSQDRFIDGEQGGTHADVVTTPPLSIAPLAPLASAGVDVASASNGVARKH